MNGMNEETEQEDQVSVWWAKNWERACTFAAEHGEAIAASIYSPDEEEDLAAFFDQTVKHMALDGLYELGIKGFEELMSEYEPENPGHVQESAQKPKEDLVKSNVDEWERVVDDGWSEDDVVDAMTSAAYDAGVEAEIGDFYKGGDTVAEELGKLGVDLRPYLNADNMSDLDESTKKGLMESRVKRLVDWSRIH